jgi:hypothetical protein
VAPVTGCDLTSVEHLKDLDLLTSCLRHGPLGGKQSLFEVIGGELIPIHDTNIRSVCDRFKTDVVYCKEFFSTGGY